MTDNRPENCRDRLWDENGCGPRSGCNVDGCGGVFGVKVCEIMENNVKDENYFLSFDELKNGVEYWGSDGYVIFTGRLINGDFVAHQLGYKSMAKPIMGLSKFIVAPKDKPKTSKYEKHLVGENFNVAGILHDLKRPTIDSKKVLLNREKTLVLIDWLNDVLNDEIK